MATPPRPDDPRWETVVCHRELIDPFFTEPFDEALHKILTSPFPKAALAAVMHDLVWNGHVDSELYRKLLEASQRQSMFDPRERREFRDISEFTFERLQDALRVAAEDPDAQYGREEAQHEVRIWYLTTFLGLSAEQAATVLAATSRTIVVRPLPGSLGDPTSN